MYKYRSPKECVNVVTGTTQTIPLSHVFNVAWGEHCYFRYTVDFSTFARLGTCTSMAVAFYTHAHVSVLEQALGYGCTTFLLT